MSYTVLTKEAEGEFSGLHHRIPVILSTDQEVQVEDNKVQQQIAISVYSIVLEL